MEADADPDVQTDADAPTTASEVDADAPTASSEAGVPTTSSEAGVRRSDRWSSEPVGPDRNWWVGFGAVLVLAGYGLAALVVSAARGSVDLSDDAGKALVAAAPASAALGATAAFVGTRRRSLRVLSWIVFVVGLILVLATLAGVVWVLLALPRFA